MGCNCSGQGSGTRFELVHANGRRVPYLTRTEAIAALSVAGAGARVVTVKG